MEGEIFARNVLGNKKPPTAQNTPNTTTVNGVNGHQNLIISSHGKPRKPWESVQFDPMLRPKDYQIKGTEASAIPPV